MIQIEISRIKAILEKAQISNYYIIMPSRQPKSWQRPNRNYKFVCAVYKDGFVGATKSNQKRHPKFYPYTLCNEVRVSDEQVDNETLKHFDSEFETNSMLFSNIRKKFFETQNESKTDYSKMTTRIDNICRIAFTKHAEADLLIRHLDEIVKILNKNKNENKELY